MIDHAAAVPYLLAQRLLAARTVVDGEVVVVDASRRNHSFAVIPASGPAYLLKQARDEAASATLRNEAAVYAWLTASQPAVARYLPAVRRYDDTGPLMVLEYFPDHETMRHRITRTGRALAAHGRLAGRALATLHGTRPGGGPPTPAGLSVPWALTLDCPEFTSFRGLSGALPEVLRIVQRHSEFDAAFARLRGRWPASTLIHNDVRWDNFLVPMTSSAALLRIVDWELAGLGDPAWDVGSMFAQYLACWVASMPAGAGLDAAATIELARYPLVRMQPAMRAFWAAYQRAADPVSDTLLTATRYAAVRLLQSAIERAQGAMQLDHTATALLQVSVNMLRWPADAASSLFGIPVTD
jgi:aminoglycoside phosphotransferase (APT) family kinase protein